MFLSKELPTSYSDYKPADPMWIILLSCFVTMTGISTALWFFALKIKLTRRPSQSVFLSNEAKKKEQFQELTQNLLRGAGRVLFLNMFLALCLAPAFYAQKIAKNNPDDVNKAWGKFWFYFSWRINGSHIFFF